MGVGVDGRWQGRTSTYLVAPREAEFDVWMRLAAQRHPQASETAPTPRAVGQQEAVISTIVWLPTRTSVGNGGEGKVGGRALPLPSRCHTTLHILTLQAKRSGQHKTVMSGLEGWERSVQVAWVDPLDLSKTVGSNQGAKRITVAVTDDGLPVASLFAFRTDAWRGLDD